jgi:hypothetical protein
LIAGENISLQMTITTDFMAHWMGGQEFCNYSFAAYFESDPYLTFW